MLVVAKIIEEPKISDELAHLPSWVLNPNLDNAIAASPKNRGGLRFQIYKLKLMLELI